MSPRQFHHFLVVLTLCVAACSQNTPSETVVRPAMTNAEYEMSQLRALGAATDAEVGDETVVARPFRDETVRSQPNLAQPNRLLTPAPRTPTLPVVVAPGKATSSRTGPMQKAGAIYIGPGGASSRQVGAIMINSDGTTGQMIGNTIFSR